MSIKIVPIGHKIYVFLSDKTLYSIFLEYPHLLTYGMNNFLIPFVTDLMSNFNGDTNIILNNHDEIMEYTYKIKDLIKNIPKLVTCRMPRSQNKTIHVEEGVSISPCIDNEYYIKTPDYLLQILDYYIVNFVILNPTRSHMFSHKVTFTDEEFDGKLFYENVKSYVNDHLSVLSDPFSFKHVKATMI